MNIGVKGLRALAVLAFSFLSLAFPACGGGGGGGPEGTLEVANDFASTDFINEIDVDDQFSPFSATFTGNVFPGESFAIALFPSSYDVTIFWGDGATEALTADVFDGTVTTVSVSH